MWLIYGYRSREIWRPLRWWAVGSPCGAGVIVIVVDHDCGISRFGRWMIVEWSKECSHGSGMFFLMARAIVVWWPCLCGHILLSGLYWQKGALDRYRVVSIDGLWPMTHESLMTHTSWNLEKNLEKSSKIVKDLKINEQNARIFTIPTYCSLSI